jgi:hypothetical protein
LGSIDCALDSAATTMKQRPLPGVNLIVFNHVFDADFCELSLREPEFDALNAYVRKFLEDMRAIAVSSCFLRPVRQMPSNITRSMWQQ